MYFCGKDYRNKTIAAITTLDNNLSNVQTAFDDIEIVEEQCYFLVRHSTDYPSRTVWPQRGSINFLFINLVWKEIAFCCTMFLPESDTRRLRSTERFGSYELQTAFPTSEFILSVEVIFSKCRCCSDGLKWSEINPCSEHLYSTEHIAGTAPHRSHGLVSYTI